VAKWSVSLPSADNIMIAGRVQSTRYSKAILFGHHQVK